MNPPIRFTRPSAIALGVACLALLALHPSLAFASDCAAAVASGGGGAGAEAGFFARALAHGPVVAMGAAFVGGLGVSLTPCVYPMIAITVSVFGANEAKSRGQAAALSGVFVLGIALLFTALGVGSALAGGVFGAALSYRPVVIALAVLFLILASSMFGAFELSLPDSLNQKLSGVGGAGYGGAFLLGLVSALVAAPCTGPVLAGILAWIAQSRSVFLGTGVMFVFALGLGTPFFIVGTFAVSLPKGGAWMVGVKWVFGVSLAIVALYFLRNAVPVLRAHVNGTWLAIGIAATVVGLALASVHVAAERRKSPIARLSLPMKLASIPFAIAGIYLAIGYALTPKHELPWVDDEASGRSLATTEHKPVIIDFGASWCTACNELTAKTFADANVYEEAKDRFVTIRVDATHMDDDPNVEAVTQKYGVKGLPVVLLIDSCGREKTRIEKFVDADEFLSAIKNVD